MNVFNPKTIEDFSQKHLWTLRNPKDVEIGIPLYFRGGASEFVVYTNGYTRTAKPGEEDSAHLWPENSSRLSDMAGKYKLVF